MKRIIGISALCALLGFCFGCSNEINLHGKGEAIPIVYCLLNPLEDAQYVRVGKTFLQTQESLESNTPIDSLVWPIDAEIYVEKWENNQPVETIVFELDPLAEKDSGLFPTKGLRLYQAGFKPIPGDEYHIYVYFAEIDKIASGETIILDVPKVIDPENVPGRTVSFDTISPYHIRWRGSDQAGLYQGVFKMNYSESFNGDFRLHNCFFRTPLYYKLSPDDIYEEKINGWNFLQSVAEQIVPLSGVQRELINFEFFFYSSGPELAIMIASETGITNPFTAIRNTSNIAGGMGVFSSLTFQRFPNLEPSVITKFFLSTSSYTNHLGFLEE